MSRDLAFHIVFVPNTLPYLAVAARTLLNNSPYRYRLVSNGLGTDELELLERFSQTDPRFEFYAYPTRSPVEHGTLLTLLFHQQREEYFCFADSDIFARSRFESWLEEELDRADAVSSCSSLLMEDLPSSAGFMGRCSHTPAGTRNLSSYFAVYRREPVRRVLQEAGIGFEKRVFRQHFSPYERTVLEEQEWGGKTCDTGKLLNFELQRRGHHLVHREDPSLLHVGGISWWLWKQNGAQDDMRSKPVVLRDEDLTLSPEQERRVDQGEDQVAQLQWRRKVARARWFSAYLFHLFGRAAKPELELEDLKLRSAILEAVESIRRAFGSDEDWKL